MPSNYSVPTPLEYFAALVQVGQGDAIALLERLVDQFEALG